MDNIISIECAGENNSIISPYFSWSAYFSDNTEILQFNEDNTENKFELVKEKFAILTEFFLYNKELSKIFKVDLKNGIINFNKNFTSFAEQIEEKKNIRLIFFRRTRKVLNNSLQELSKDIHYFLGFQYNDKNNNNRQYILEIDELGNFIVLGE